MKLRNIMISTLMSVFVISAETPHFEEYFPSETGSNWNYAVTVINTGWRGIVERKIKVVEKNDTFIYARSLRDSVVSGIPNTRTYEYRDSCFLQEKYYCSSDSVPNPEAKNVDNILVDNVIPFTFEGADYIKFGNYNTMPHNEEGLTRIAKRNVGLVYRGYSKSLYPYGYGEQWILMNYNDSPIDTNQVRRLINASDGLSIKTRKEPHVLGGNSMTDIYRGRNVLGRAIHGRFLGVIPNEKASTRPKRGNENDKGGVSQKSSSKE